jgi:hypothetical protein
MFFYTLIMMACVACALNGNQVPEKMMLSFLVPVSVGIAFLSFITFKRALGYREALGVMGTYLEKLGAAVNGCSDTYTKLDVKLNIDLAQTWHDIFTNGVIPLQISIFVLEAFAMIGIGFLYCTKVLKGQ